MGTHMKTTIDIADPLLNQVRKLAAREGTTLKVIVERGLQQVLRERQSRSRFRLKDASVDGKGLRPDARRLSWDQIRDLSYEGPSSDTGR